MRHKAAEVIRQQLETRETALLYCMLGDATDEVEHYERALAMTEGRSARAHRALGMHHYFRKEYAKAVEHMARSLELNSFQVRNPAQIFSKNWSGVQSCVIPHHIRYLLLDSEASSCNLKRISYHP